MDINTQYPFRIGTRYRFEMALWQLTDSHPLETFGLHAFDATHADGVLETIVVDNRASIIGLRFVGTKRGYMLPIHYIECCWPVPSSEVIDI
jgi:hypothetical protein